MRKFKITPHMISESQYYCVTEEIRVIPFFSWPTYDKFHCFEKSVEAAQKTIVFLKQEPIDA